MKVYESGSGEKPVLLLLPGTCCHWKENFGQVIPLLEQNFRVAAVSYDGFDESEETEFPTMIEETEKIERYIRKHFGGHVCGIYGCSLGGSFVGLIAARGNIRMDYGILGGSDLDQSGRFAARLKTKLILRLVYPLIATGELRSGLLRNQLEKSRAEAGGYVDAFIKMFGAARPYVTRRSVANQFYSDLITPLPSKIDPPWTEIHILYALKMGGKYRERYLRHFAHPVLHELNSRHEELLVCHPEEWAELITSICLPERSEAQTYG